jgi:hypothetical protein
MSKDAKYPKLLDMAFVIRILITLIFSSIVTIGLFFIENRSNLPSILLIPMIASLLTKYVLGDWDKGFQMSFVDVPYWISMLGTSYGTVWLLTRYTGRST